jgi:hypothetical protein
MTDIPVLIERLRNGEFSAAPGPRLKLRIPSDLELEAADALSRLSEDKKRLEEALEPWAASADKMEKYLERFPAMSEQVHAYGRVVGWTLENARAARSALRGE